MNDGELFVTGRLKDLIIIRGENYYRADIVVGRVGPDQTTPRREFD